MSTIHGTGSYDTTTPDTTHDAETNANSTLARRALATLRIAFGFTFLWAFFDKLLALGFGTAQRTTPPPAETVDRFGDAAWINGGSPTEGFLKFGADGPFDSFYHSIAGDAWADWLFMLGLLGIGARADPRHRHADRRRRRRAALPHDVDRRACPPTTTPSSTTTSSARSAWSSSRPTSAGMTWGLDAAGRRSSW